MTEDDLRHLRRCAELAAEALEAGDAPFGSVLVAGDGTVLHEDRNRESTGVPTHHPELMLALWAAEHLDADARSDATVYTSGEHCPMCAGAHAYAGVGRIVFAVSGEQYAAWRASFGLADRGIVGAFSAQQIAPRVRVEGPAEAMADVMHDLHRRHAERLSR